MLWNELMNLQRDFERYFNRDWSTATSMSRGRFPAVNIFNKDNALVVKAEVPGIGKDDINTELRNNVLKISGKKSVSPNQDVITHRRERAEGTFERLFELPLKVDPEKVTANLTNGVLTVEMEKADEEKGRKITIQ